ncbi:MerR family transcriptional regulator [Streptacidiphilus albus]|uniref:MerR family transcriptional regulator n=1 Tax=Streptacidiphilus albus TaxID=105425 RepID=UPI0007C8789A|nr:MerR family transcriptional regulator [Streptacidiphilus albus]
MLIGQLARATGTSERLLRYYESVGLLTSDRHSNGYREYDADAEQTVRRIRALLAAGLSTGLIRQLMPCGQPDGSLRPCPGVLDKLRTQLAHLDRRAEELALARQTLSRAIEDTERQAGWNRRQNHVGGRRLPSAQDPG